MNLGNNWKPIGGAGGGSDEVFVKIPDCNKIMN